MEFYEVLDQVIALLKRHGRVSSRALKHQFNLDDDFIEDLKDELLHSRHPITEEDDKSLVWTGDPPKPETDGEIVSHLHQHFNVETCQSYIQSSPGDRT